MLLINSLQQLSPDLRYTYADYLLWQIKERVELLRGRLFPMSAPSVRHQKVSSNLHGHLWAALKGRPCQVFSAPFDVRLPLPPERVSADKIDTVVQPDLCVICDERKLDRKGCVGPPELVIEILSPGNSKKEMVDKYTLYEAAGVLEYWIVDPEHNAVFGYRLEAGRFVASAPPRFDGEVLHSHLFPEIALDLAEVFPPMEED